MPRSSTGLILQWSIGTAFALAAAMPAHSQGASRVTPKPPARPPITTPAPTPAPTPARPVVPSDDADLDPDHPPVLPPAPRAKMHACGREWQDMKRRGADRDTTWRQFATACLQRG